MGTNSVIDYDAIAQQHGGSVASGAVDYDALAAQHGGTAAKPVTPKLSLYEQARQSFEKQKSLPADQRTESGLQNSFEGHPENIGEYPVATAGRAAEGAVDISRGNVAMGAHKLIQAGSNALAPMAPLMAAGAPLTALRALGGGVVGSNVAGAAAQASGASDDQKALAEDAGNIVGGGVAATGALRAFLGSPTKALIGKAAGALDGVVSDDVLGIVSPRALHGLRMLRAANKIAGGAADSELSSIATKHTEAISGLESQLNEALSKANALPPEGPTAQFKDVPDLRVQPSQQAPQNLLAKPAALPGKPQMTQGGQFQVVPPEGAVPEAGRLPDMEIYKEPIQPPKPLKPPTLLEQLRQWDQIRQIHSQLEDQIGKGQDEIQQWMEDHNQESAGGKSTAAKTAKAKFDAARAKAVPAEDQPRVPTSDEDMESLLMKSVQAAKAKKAMSAKAGD